MDPSHQQEKMIAIVGTGYWGKNLVRIYHELGMLHSICDTNRNALKDFKDKYPGLWTTHDVRELLENPDIRGIVIALPAELHYHVAKEALNAGKNVFVEKPLALRLAEAEELVETAEEKGITLMVGHLLQYHPVFNKLKKLVHRGELGSIYYIYSNRLSLGKIRREENSLWSFAPHDISMILSLCQEEPIRVYATGGNYLQDKIADVTVTHLVFPSGVRSHIFVSWLHPFKEQKLVVVGEDKMAVFSDSEDWENKLFLYSHSIDWDEGVPIPRKADPQKIKVEESEPLKNECLHFLECLEQRKRPITDGREGLRVLKVLHQAQEQLEMQSQERPK